MGVSFGQIDLLRFDGGTVQRTEDFLVEEIQPVPDVQVASLEPYHTVGQRLVFGMPALFASGQVALPAAVVVAGVAAVEVESVFKIESEVDAFVVKTFAVEELVFLAHRFFLDAGAHAPGAFAGIARSLFGDDVDDSRKGVRAIDYRHRTFDDFDPFDPVYVELAEALFGRASVDHRNTVHEDFDVVAAHTHQLEVRFSERHVVREADADFGVEQRLYIQGCLLPDLIAVYRPYLI